MKPLLMLTDGLVDSRKGSAGSPGAVDSVKPDDKDGKDGPGAHMPESGAIAVAVGLEE